MERQSKSLPAPQEEPYVVESLLNAIKDLDVRDRLILTYYYFENLSYKEIAKALGIPLERVTQTHVRILELLKSKLSHPKEESTS